MRGVRGLIRREQFQARNVIGIRASWLSRKSARTSSTDAGRTTARGIKR